MLSEAERNRRELKKHLRNITKSVRSFLTLLDYEMTKPSSHERGQRIAKLASELQLRNDMARHFGLGESLKSATRRALKESE